MVVKNLFQLLSNSAKILTVFEKDPRNGFRAKIGEPCSSSSRQLVRRVQWSRARGEIVCSVSSGVSALSNHSSTYF